MAYTYADTQAYTEIKNEVFFERKENDLGCHIDPGYIPGRATGRLVAVGMWIYFLEVQLLPL